MASLRTRLPVTVAPFKGAATLVEPKPAPSDPLRDRPAAFDPARPCEIISPLLIRTPRLTIRPPGERDRDAMVEALTRSRARIEPALPMFRPGEPTRAAFDRQLALTVEGDRRATAWRRIATLRDGTIVGGVALRNIQRGLCHRAEMLWWTAAGHERRGFGVELVAAAVRFAFLPLPEGLGLDRVNAMIQPDNIASLRLARAIGFRSCPSEDGLVDISGRRVPHHAYAIDAPVAPV